MNPLIQPKTTVLALLSASVLAGFAILPKAQAVVPPPDGGYPGGNTAEGQAALLSLTTGGFNTAVGFLALRSNTTGALNTAVGAGTLLANTADQNTAMGAGALLSNMTGAGNTGLGAFALFANSIGDFNTANGARALHMNTEGDRNTANGFGALQNNTSGASNTATGFITLSQNSTGNNNTANGDSALGSNTTGFNNTAIGNIAFLNNTTGNNNTALGANAGLDVTTANNVIAIGSRGANVDNSCFIGNIRGAIVAPDAVQILIDSAGKLGTVSGSSRRFKNDIKRMDNASEAILALKPVTFRYKAEIDPSRALSFGLIAEEVAEISPDLITRDKEGKPQTVRYDAVNAMLLNEFLKEHRTVQEQQKEIDALKQELKEQRALIEKVNARIETDKALPQLAVDKL
jgi:hypothetical protein